jgi:hypothetical protein
VYITLHRNRDIQAGVTQVSVLSPTLYSLYINETWCEHWNIKFNDDRTQAIYFSQKLRPPEAHITLNGQNHQSCKISGSNLR